MLPTKNPEEPKNRQRLLQSITESNDEGVAIDLDLGVGLAASEIGEYVCQRCRALCGEASAEGGGDEAEYFGQESGKVILTGNAWAVQDNNTLKSQRLTVYLNETGKAQVSDQ